MGRAILVGLGSSGDVHPLLGIAEGMQRRGHECVVVSAPRFEASARSVGAGFSPLGTAEAYDALVVHHGGIGTAGRALQAGAPQLIVPSGFDQFDNAARVVRGGWGRELDRRRLDADRLASIIEEVLDDAAMRGRCVQVRDRLAAVDAVDETCAAIEGLLPP